MLGSMAPEPTGDGEATTASFRGGVEQVDETTSGRGKVRAEPAPARLAGRNRRVRARKVHRIVRHIEPWSVLKVSLLFFFTLFLILCVASAVLWNGARRSGAIENVEDFITETGSFGNCPDLAPVVPPVVPPVTTPTTLPATTTSTTLAVASSEDEAACADGAERVDTFKFKDSKIFRAFALGGIVLVLAGSAGAVVMALLFNLMSDLTGGIRVTVLEVDPASRSARTGSPGPKRRG